MKIILKVLSWLIDKLKNIRQPEENMKGNYKLLYMVFDRISN